MNDKELLDYLKSTFEESKTLTEGSRKEGRDAYEYMRGNQLPADVIEALEDRGQPATWENIYAKIDNKVEGSFNTTACVGSSKTKSILFCLLKSSSSLLYENLKNFSKHFNKHNNIMLKSFGNPILSYVLLKIYKIRLEKLQKYRLSIIVTFADYLFIKNRFIL